MSAVCWTSCLRCLRRFAFPLCSRRHPVLCAACAAIAPEMDMYLANRAEEGTDGRA